MEKDTVDPSQHRTEQDLKDDAKLEKDLVTAGDTLTSARKRIENIYNYTLTDLKSVENLTDIYDSIEEAYIQIRKEKRKTLLKQFLMQQKKTHKKRAAKEESEASYSWSQNIHRRR